MNNVTTIAIIGLYTLVYIVVFIIQTSQIKKQKDIINSMKTFIDIFKVDEVKKYVEMREERIKGDFENMISNESRVQEMVKEVSKNTIGKVEEFYKEKTGEKIKELFSFCLITLKNFPLEEREMFIQTHFFKTGDTIRKALSELDEDNSTP